MFEEYTFEKILDSVLSAVPDNFDKREGAIIYDAIAPACVEVAKIYIEMDRILNEMFADTASRIYLIKRASERGIYPKDSVKAVIYADLKGEFKIYEGARFNADEVNFVYTGKKYGEYYLLECEESGEKGNITGVNIIPIDYIDGLKSAYAVGISVYGESEEDTEVFRKRFLESVQRQAFGGNIADYKQKVKAIEGVGGLKVYRAEQWNGGGTVKLVVQASDYKAPTASFTESLQTLIDPVSNKGEGLGIAPIGHQVSVFGVNEVKINISMDIKYADGYNFENTKGVIKEAITEYLSRINEEWESTDNLIVYILRLGAEILSVDGILDIENIMINEKNENFQLGENEIIDIENSTINGEKTGGDEDE